MKKILVALVAIFTLGVNTASAQKIGHVDYDKAVDTLSTYKLAMAKRDELEAVYNDQVEALSAEYEQKVRDFQADQATMSDIIKEIRAGQIQEIEGYFQQLQQKYQQDLQIIQTRYMEPLNKWLEDAIAEVGTARGLDYILYYNDEASFVWANPAKATDVTNEVIAALMRIEAARKATDIKEPGQ